MDALTNVNPEITFTRYLYIKDEVKNALIIGILKKESLDKCLFWTYELYYSGFQEELFELIFKIYYDFFATINPQLEQYIIVKYKEWRKNSLNESIPGLIIANLLSRSFNMDVFILRQIVANFDIEPNYTEDCDISNGLGRNLQLSEWLENKDYESLARFILEDCPEKSLDLCVIITSKFHGFNIDANIDKKLLINYNKAKNIYKNPRHIVLAKIISEFTLIKSKNIYISNSINIATYQTKDIHILGLPEGRAYCILPLVCKYNINSSTGLHLFLLGRRKVDLNDAYNYNWLFYASFAPIWQSRILEYKGAVSQNLKKVVFEDEDSQEQFYDMFSLEPDEQKLEIQNKCIQEIKDSDCSKSLNTWQKFYNKNNHYGIITGNSISEYLEELTKIAY